MDPATRLLPAVMVFGAAGFLLENAAFGPRYSNLFRGARVPFLPVYAAGGAAALALAPYLRTSGLAWYERAAVYGGMLSGIEILGCRIDRDVLDGCAWDYSGARCSDPEAGCASLTHFVLWGMMGLAVEKLDERLL